MTREEAASCINTIVILKNLCYRVHGLMDVIDAQNCDKIIEMLNTVGETHKKHTETHASDCVSRQAAIDAFGLSEKTRKYGGDHSGYDTRMLYEIQDILEGLPSAQPSNGACWGCQCEKAEKLQPEREKGKWIVCGDNHVCSECDEFALCDAYDVLETGEYQEKLSDFCPNCGADMR